MQRWLQQHSQCDFEIVHRPGLKHGNADAMCRLVQGNYVICRQCSMPWHGSMKNSIDTYRDEQDSEISKNLDILENSEDNSVEAVILEVLMWILQYRNVEKGNRVKK